MFTSLHHLIDGEWMREAYRRTRKDGATGIDGVTAADYEKDLEANLDDLLSRIKSGRYLAPPVRRHYIPKADGTNRPLGIPTFEDKVAQRAILMLLEPIYETDFLPCSHGFRPERSAHDALKALRSGIIEQRQRWVIDADLKAYFDSISLTHLRSFLDLRIKDGVVRRMIDKWLKAGVLEEGIVHRPVAGTPQGGASSHRLSPTFSCIMCWTSGSRRRRGRACAATASWCDTLTTLSSPSKTAKAPSGCLTRWANVSVDTG
ncbi:MAG: transcription elongation factor GreAB [Boseongicola sp. SB0675_bin_26]|nr:transcription elongation factor GreAB [Boseongicola sp. SB0675_bin_26]